MLWEEQGALPPPPWKEQGRHRRRGGDLMPCGRGRRPRGDATPRGISQRCHAMSRGAAAAAVTLWRSIGEGLFVPTAPCQSVKKYMATSTLWRIGRRPHGRSRNAIAAAVGRAGAPPPPWGRCGAVRQGGAVGNRSEKNQPVGRRCVKRYKIR